MALIKCKECGKRISNKAKACPNCGAERKKTGCFTWIVAIFVAVIMIVYISSQIEKNKAPSPTKKTTTTTAQPFVPDCSMFNEAKSQYMELGLVTMVKNKGAVWYVDPVIWLQMSAVAKKELVGQLSVARERCYNLPFIDIKDHHSDKLLAKMGITGSKLVSD